MNNQKDLHEQYMWMAIDLAEQAAKQGEIPVGALAVAQGTVVGVGYNKREASGDPTAHAEILALRTAALSRGSWRLNDVDLYVTLEPCPMCAGALVNARVSRLIYGCSDPKAGAVKSLFSICEDPRLNHRVQVIPGILADECSALLKDFFASLRGNT
ncbi:MAG: tRNA adenosine(34) deaminase TadA [Pseudomonadota bacterium]